MKHFLIFLFLGIFAIGLTTTIENNNLKNLTVTLISVSITIYLINNNKIK